MHKDYDWARLVTWINYIGKSALRRKKEKKRGSISENGNSNEKMKAFHCCNQKKPQITTNYETGTALYSLNLSVLCGVEGS